MILERSWTKTMAVAENVSEPVGDGRMKYLETYEYELEMVGLNILK